MTIDLEVQGEMFAEETADGLMVLLTITHSALSVDIRVALNNATVTSRGEEFLPYPFDITLPTDDPDSPPRARLAIDNVSLELTQAIRSIQGAAAVLIEVVQLNDPDSVQLAFPELALRNVRWDASRLTGDLVSEDLQTEPWPALSFTPAHFPGLF